MGFLLSTFELAAVMGISAASQGGSVMLSQAWPGFLAASGWPDVDGGFLMKLLAVVVGVLAIAAFATSILKNIRDLWTKPVTQSGPPQPFIVTLKEQFVEKEVFDGLKADTHNQIKEIRAYVHEGVHAMNGSMEALSRLSQERHDSLSEKLEEHWDSLNRDRSENTKDLHARLELSERELMRQNKETEKELAGVKKEAETHTQQLVAVDTKLTNILQRLPRIGGRP